MDMNYFDSMLRAKKEYARTLDPICKEWDLTRNELDVLLFLANNPGYDRAADIVSRRGIAKSHVSLAVGNLENRGLLTRRSTPEDRRTVHLELTDKAQDIVQEGRQAQQDFFTRLFDGLTEVELSQYQTIVMKIYGNLEKMETDSGECACC